MKLNLICWLVLVVLTIAGVTVSGANLGGATHGIILSAAFVKSGLVGWRFMELHRAHVAWKSAFLLLIAGLTGLFFVLA